MGKYKVLSVYYSSQGLPEYKDNAERLVSCWNAFKDVKNPEQDFKQIVKALKIIQEYKDELLYANPTALNLVYKNVDEALALIKE